MTGTAATVGPEPALVVLSLVSDLLDSLPPEVRELVEAAPAPATVQGAVLYGGTAILGGAGLKKLVGRLRSGSTATASGATGTVVTTADSSGGIPESIKHDEAAFTLPSFLPVSKGIREVTHNEVHAFELGIVVGFVTVWLYSIGRTNAAGAIVVAFVAGGLGFRRYKSKAVATVRMEPWYAFLAFAAGAGGGWLFFEGMVPLP